jgi:hypothetical protein
MARPDNYQAFRQKCKILVAPGLDQKLIQVLCDPQNRNLELKYKEQVFNYNLLNKVAGEIQNAKVMVCFDGQGTSLPNPFSAKYVEGYDILLMNFQDTSDLYARGAIIHEATHIINDRRGKKVRDLANEEAAFIYQAMYYRLSGMRGQNFPGAINNLFPAAFAIADRLLKKQAPLLSEDLALEREIMSMPEYQNQINSPNKMRAYDGIPSK